MCQSAQDAHALLTRAGQNAHRGAQERRTYAAEPWKPELLPGCTYSAGLPLNVHKGPQTFLRAASPNTHSCLANGSYSFEEVKLVYNQIKEVSPCSFNAVVYALFDA